MAERVLDVGPLIETRPIGRALSGLLLGCASSALIALSEDYYPVTSVQA